MQICKTQHFILLFIIPFLFLSSCEPPEPENVLSQTDESNQGMVVASHPLATQAGLKMLEMGGNAADAAAAVGFALSVVEPSMSGLGGRMQTLLRYPNGDLHGIDASTEAPIGFAPDTIKSYNDGGYKVIGIPGVVAGLTALLEEHGTLPLATVMAPAIQYAEEGFEVLEDQARWHERSKKVLQQYPGSRQYFMKNDSVTYHAGEQLIQTDLAKTLRLIAAEGKDVFYKGEIAQKIVADNEANGGFLNLESLAQYEAKQSKILSGNYRGYNLHGLWLPSFGAITIEILHILENLPIDELNEVEWANAVGQAINLAYQDRKSQSDSIDFAEKLISKDYAKTLAAKIDLDSFTKPLSQLFLAPVTWKGDMGHTTHFSVADKDGMVIASTQSLGPLMGSKVSTPGLGFLYAVSLVPSLGVERAGQRVVSHISPFLVTKDEQPFLVLGAAGGSRIVSAIVQVTSRFIDQQLPLGQAVGAARVHPIRDTFYLEAHPGIDWDDAGVDLLIQKGFHIKEIDEPFRFGRVHAVHYNAATKTWTGAADPDGVGTAMGLRLGK